MPPVIESWKSAQGPRLPSACVKSGCALGSFSAALRAGRSQVLAGVSALALGRCQGWGEHWSSPRAWMLRVCSCTLEAALLCSWPSVLPRHLCTTFSWSFSGLWYSLPGAPGSPWCARPSPLAAHDCLRVCTCRVLHFQEMPTVSLIIPSHTFSSFFHFPCLNLLAV